jgi:L-alanine-DL-glutamate epimerase-like enolase superfamily enzyme
MAAAVLAAAILQVGTPHRGRVPGWWLFPILEVVLLAVLVIADPGRIDRRARLTRWFTIVLITVMSAATLAGIGILMYDILAGLQGINATDLLGRGAAVWVGNVIVFSLWFWELDRGGPVERAAGSGLRPSFAFPEDATPDLVPKGWMPTYLDYLYLAYTNATAFSPTDTLPIRMWAKMTMMLQSSASLLTAILVIARAINIL